MTKIVIIGAGSASFGLETLSALMYSARLRGSHLALVDRNPDALGLMARLAARLNREWDAQMRVTAHAGHDDALDGADFVVSAIEAPPREKLWQQDWEIPLKYGVRQPYAENGGPGGFAHAARNIGPVLEIAHAMGQACPDAWFINFSNPMVRICDAIHRYSKIKVVGLCHQIFTGYGMVGYALADRLGIEVPDGVISTHADPDLWPRLGRIVKQVVEKIDIQAAGLNHFTWMLDVRDRRTGEDLYPLFAERWARLDPGFEPLTRRVYAAFGCFPIPGDEHLCEYLPWVSDPVTRPWEKYEVSLYDWERNARRRREGHALIAQMADGAAPVDELRERDGEGTRDIVETIAAAGRHYHLAVNLPNIGQIGNLPAGAIVETPAVITGAGISPVAVGDMPTGVAELLRRELTVAQLAVDAAVQGDRQLALQCLLLDPVITDLDVAQQILDDYLDCYRDYLPQFWR
ncbi:MAG: Alpha-glucosidase [Chloroflexi bacterium ADurb.Bin325]|nr:MAG: Alpha-glucosidase [Chloroflexi bacterium ADurb.Bin325]